MKKLLTITLLLVPCVVWAQGATPDSGDEPRSLTSRSPAKAAAGEVALPNDEPHLDRRTGLSRNPYANSNATDSFWYRLDLSFGWVSLAEDPDLDQGFGGGFSLAMGFHPRVGVEFTFFVGQNAFNGEFGTIANSAFLAWNLSLGPVVRLTPESWPVSVTAELSLGFFGIKDPIRQDAAWTLGVSGGATVAYHLRRWIAVGFKLRYNLFNLSSIAGEELLDIKSLEPLGTLDRFELPIFVGFFF